MQSVVPPDPTGAYPILDQPRVVCQPAVTGIVSEESVDPLHRATRGRRRRAERRSKGNSFDNALAESVICLYKNDLINKQ